MGRNLDLSDRVLAKNYRGIFTIPNPGFNYGFRGFLVLSLEKGNCASECKISSIFHLRRDIKPLILKVVTRQGKS
ncbi:hypothetical protein L2E82_45582 [Cichorium intybus]|uniref:Uncharacterized protein n=1 Tax=Cichorium intybus TaxID=13427 RepID=A0ACB8ZTA0_CICIN|nr:hypothetical protein L2E82_45582 [Cichorium intybus]